MRDLRGKWVFPRLAYSLTGHMLDRNLRRLFRFLIARPITRVVQFIATLRDHRDNAEIFLAGIAVLTAFLRALSLLVALIVVLYLTAARL